MFESILPTDLYLQHIISSDTFVVHLMIRIIGITTTLILHKGEPGRVNLDSPRLFSSCRLTSD